MNESLKGKVFVIGQDQALRYDETLKALLGYIAEKYYHYVTSSVQHRDKAVGVKLVVKPIAPTKEDPSDSSKTVLGKDGEEWLIYQLTLKKYIDCKIKLDDDIQQIFNIVLGKFSPGMEQALAAVKDYKLMKEEADSIKLLKNIEQICYNYQPHEYPPPGAWEALDILGKDI